MSRLLSVLSELELLLPTEIQLVRILLTRYNLIVQNTLLSIVIPIGKISLNKALLTVEKFRGQKINSVQKKNQTVKHFYRK